MRTIEIDGLFNARATSASTPWLIRTGAPAAVSVDGVSTLRSMGVSVIIDLREPSEIGPADHGIPVRSVALYGVEPPQTGRLEEVYESLLRDRAAALTAAVALIADADGAALVHCTAGKDRTGLVVALARLAAGDSAEQVVADYVLSEPDVRLTSKLSQLTAGYSDIEDLLIVARPHLEAMHADFDEEVHLAVLDGGYMQFVDYIPSSQVVRSNLSTTQRLVHETAAGRAALAPLGAEERAEALALSAAGAQMVFSEAEISMIQRELDDARDRGWAGHDSGDGVSRFAAPIVNAEGHPVAAMCISGPSFRVNPRSAVFAAAVVDAAEKASRALRGGVHA